MAINLQLTKLFLLEPIAHLRFGRPQLFAAVNCSEASAAAACLQEVHLAPKHVSQVCTVIVHMFSKCTAVTRGL
jgi:hypothetical protein